MFSRFVIALFFDIFACLTNILQNQLEAAEQERREVMERSLANASNAETLLLQEISSIKSQLKDAESSNTTLSNDLSSKKEEISDLETQLHTLQTSIKALEQQHSSSQEEITNLQEENTRLQEQKTSIEERLTSTLQEKEMLEQEKERVETLLNDLEKRQGVESVTVVTNTTSSNEQFRETVLDALLTAAEVSSKMNTISYRITQNRLHELISSLNDTTEKFEEEEVNDDNDETVKVEELEIDETKYSRFHITYKKLIRSIHSLRVEIHELENQLAPEDKVCTALIVSLRYQLILTHTTLIPFDFF